MSLGRIIAWTLLFLIGACSRAPTTTPPATVASREYFPLHPGTLWVYEIRDAAGNVDLERVLVRGPLHLKTQETDGVVVEESGGIGGELGLDVAWHPVVYYRRGSFLYKFSGISYVETELREYRLGIGEEKVLPDDPFRHPEWESDVQLFRLGQGLGYALRAVSTARSPLERVTVPAGTFEACLRVETASALASLPRRPDGGVAFRYTDWYAPGVGLVKSVVEAPGHPTPVAVTRLVSFRDGARPD